MPNAGKRLGRLIVKIPPAALAGEGRTLLRNLIDKRTLGIEGTVIKGIVRLVKMAHVAVPFSATFKGSTTNDRRAVEAASAARKGAPGEGPKTDAPRELPNGQWCSKGTCHFTRDKVNPGGPAIGIRCLWPSRSKHIL
eukprot:3550468-Pleurochrysis_carterae.AAC.1